LAQGLVDLEHRRARDDTQPRPNALDGNGPDLLGLGLGVSGQPSVR